MAIVARAAPARRPVCVGRHPKGDRVTIDLSGYHRILRVDRDNGSATVEAGIAVGHLDHALASWGLSLENGVRNPDQALGAAVSVGAHGTGARFGGLVTQVTALRLVAPDGSVVDCSADEEPEIFDAARVGLGALGVLSTVTVRCQRGFNLRAATTTLDLDRALGDLDALAAANDHVELSWLAGRHTARVTTANRTSEPPDGRGVDRAYRWFNRRPTRRPKSSEYSYPRDESGPALQRARQRGDSSRTALPFPIVVSVTAADDVALSPTQGRPSIYIAGVAGLDGRPQWGVDASMYPRFGEWQAVRDRLDPERRFAQTSGHG